MNERKLLSEHVLKDSISALEDVTARLKDIESGNILLSQIDFVEMAIEDLYAVRELLRWIDLFVPR